MQKTIHATLLMVAAVGAATGTLTAQPVNGVLNAASFSGPGHRGKNQRGNRNPAKRMWRSGRPIWDLPPNHDGYQAAMYQVAWRERIWNHLGMDAQRRNGNGI